MPISARPPDGTPNHPQLHISDTVVARVAAYHACRVAGVRRLRPDLAQSMVSVATRLFPPHDGEPRIPTDGVTATVADDRVEISIALVAQWGRNCRDIAEQIQDQVTEQVRSYTGLSATVNITITDIDIDYTD